MRKFQKIVLLLLLIISLSITNLFAQDFYNIDTINTIKLKFEQSNWDELLDQLVTNGEEERLLGTAIINGITYDSVGVRYKGNSSYQANNAKNPLNIKLDYIRDDQELQGYGTIKLSNGYKDPSFIREVLSYEIAREYMPASSANYCKVYVNDTYLGLYTSVQDVDKHFMRTHYYSGGHPFFKGELATGKSPTVVKIWGYFGTDSTSYTNYYEIESDEGWSDLIAFLDTFNNNVDAVETVLNIDRHLWMLAFDVLLVNLDAPINFGHNYYLYQDAAGRFNPVIWDLNESFGVFSRLLDGNGLNTTTMQEMDPFLNSTNDNYPIVKQILSNPTYKKMYVAHMKTIIDEFFANGGYRTRALEIQNIIDAEIQNDPNYSYSYSQFKDNIDNSITDSNGPGRQSSVGIVELMDERISYLNSQPEFLAEQPIISNISNTPSEVASYEDVWITAEVQSANTVQLAYRYSEVEAFTKIDMFDDSNHHDGAAGDGTYGASVPVGSSGIQYYIYAENDDAALFSPRKAAYEYYTIETTGSLVINEFMASNDVTASDQDGEYDDWIEFYNNSDSDIDLTGYYLSDDADDLTKWIFPDTSIAAGGYLIVWADNDEEQNGLHTNFKLSASGEAIYFSDPDQVVINEIVFGAQQADVSIGRYPNGAGAFEELDPTFSKQNKDNILAVNENKLEEQNKQDLFLQQNYPNPFNMETTISYNLPEDSEVMLQIYDIRGQHVSTLVNSHQSAGAHSVVWDGSNSLSGIYFYRISTGNHAVAKRMVLMK